MMPEYQVQQLLMRVQFVEDCNKELFAALQHIGMHGCGLPDTPFDRNMPILDWQIKRIEEYEKHAQNAVAAYIEAISMHHEEAHATVD